MNVTKTVTRGAIALPVIGLMLVGGAGFASAHGFMGNWSDEQKEVLEEARTMRQDGQLDEAMALLNREGIQLPERARERIAERQERWAERAGHREAVEEAMNTNDINALKELMKDRPNAELITEENFAKLKEAHELRMNGDRDGAREIMQSLGFEPQGRMHGRVAR